jgi:hypothetical protein
MSLPSRITATPFDVKLPRSGNGGFFKLKLQPDVAPDGAAFATGGFFE